MGSESWPHCPDILAASDAGGHFLAKYPIEVEGRWFVLKVGRAEMGEDQVIFTALRKVPTRGVDECWVLV